MTPEQKEWIDTASYEDLLAKWRFAPAGDPFFTGETALYFEAKMKTLRETIGSSGHAAASKRLGWR